MNIIRAANVLELLKNRGEFKKCAVALGNFDGIHGGHQVLLRHTLNIAKEENLMACAYTFWPRPGKILRGDQSYDLFTLAQKERAFRKLGFAELWIQDFDGNFAAKSADVFARELLDPALGVRKILMGEDFAFGKDRQGSPAFLRERAAPEQEIIVDTLKQSEHGKLGSSRIRALLENSGDVRLAAEHLGRFYLLEGAVIKGDQLGRTLGFPTANLDPKTIEQVIPRTGVYAAHVVVAEQPEIFFDPSDERCAKAVVNIGYRPTVSAEKILKIEVHLMDQSVDLYGKKLGVYFAERLRDERKFSSLDALKAQIRTDIDLAKKIL